MRTRKDDLSGAVVRQWPARMRVVSQREFFRTPALVNSLRPGEVLAVLKDGEPSFLALKPGPRPQHSTQDLIRLAQAQNS